MEKPESITKLNTRIENNERIIKVNMNKRERKILLRMIDAKDLISEERAKYSFIEGFKLGLKIGYAVNIDHNEK